MRRKAMEMKKGKIALLLSAAMILGLTGCGKQKEEQIILITEDAEEITYTLGVATIGEVIKSANIRCAYESVNSEDLYFKSNGKMVSKVYVEEGDEVKKGQLLAELVTTDTEENMSNLQYQIDKNELMLKQIKENMEYDLSLEDLKYSYTNQWFMDAEKHEETVADIKESYRYSIEDYEDTLKIQYMQMDAYRQEIADGRLYAGIIGTVSYMQSRLEGSTSNTQDRVIGIVDSTDCIFTTDSTEYAEYYNEKESVLMKISISGNTGEYIAWPILPNEKNPQLSFALDEQYAGINVSLGTTGTTEILLDQREQVLRVPLKAVMDADGKYFVYVLNDSGFKDVVWIEPGLFGNEYVEVLSGLSEGDKVILK